MPFQKPTRSDIPALIAGGALAYFVIGTISGAHPDAGILGFSATMWGIWATSEQRARQRRERLHRWREDEQERLQEYEDGYDDGIEDF